LTISFALHQFSQTIIRHTVWLLSISAPRSAALAEAPAVPGGGMGGMGY
jgi:hypothetical protein